MNTACWNYRVTLSAWGGASFTILYGLGFRGTSMDFVVISCAKGARVYGEVSDYKFAMRTHIGSNVGGLNKIRGCLLEGAGLARRHVTQLGQLALAS